MYYALIIESRSQLPHPGLRRRLPPAAPEGPVPFHELADGAGMPAVPIADAGFDDGAHGLVAGSELCPPGARRRRCHDESERLDEAPLPECSSRLEFALAPGRRTGGRHVPATEEDVVEDLRVASASAPQSRAKAFMGARPEGEGPTCRDRAVACSAASCARQAIGLRHLHDGVEPADDEHESGEDLHAVADLLRIAPPCRRSGSALSGRPGRRARSPRPRSRAVPSRCAGTRWVRVRSSAGPAPL